MLYIGTCGYSYADWKGRFYPAGLPSSAMLEYYAERFAAVEIDATYYRVLPASTFASLARRTPEHFRFAAKVPGSATRVVADAPVSIGDDVRRFRENLQPLVGAGKFGCALLQFPNAFKPTGRAHEYLRALRAALADLPLVAEFRHAAWQTAESIGLLSELTIGWCNVDEPQLSSLMRPGAEVTGRIGYVRFHGRNRAKWFRHAAAHERYDYLYSAEELAPWTHRVSDVAAEAETTYVFFNNHFLGKAPANARQFARMLGVALPQPPADPSLFAADP